MVLDLRDLGDRALHRVGVEISRIAHVDECLARHPAGDVMLLVRSTERDVSYRLEDHCSPQLRFAAQ